MISKYIVSGILAVVFFIGEGMWSIDIAQESSDIAKESPLARKVKKNDFEIFLSVSTTGGGIGGKLKWGDRENTLHTLTLEVGGVKDEKEYLAYNYYWGYYETMNRKRYVFLVPMFYGIQKRLFKDKIEDNFRPFYIVEAGPLYGVRFPVGNGFFSNIKRGRSGITLGGFVGGGIEMGDASSSIFSFSVGYRIAYFFNKLVDEQNFSAFILRLGLVTHF